MLDSAYPGQNSLQSGMLQELPAEHLHATGASKHAGSFSMPQLPYQSTESVQVDISQKKKQPQSIHGNTSRTWLLPLILSNTNRSWLQTFFTAALHHPSS